MIIRGLGFHSLVDPEHSHSSQQHSQSHSPEPAPHSQPSQHKQFSIVDEKNYQVNELPLPIEQVDWNNVGKREEDSQTGYAGYVEEPKTYIGKETEANSAGYEVTHEWAMSNDVSGYAEEYLESPEEEKEDEEVLEIGDRVVELLSGIKGVVVGFLDGRVVFDCSELGRCSRRAILLKKI